MTEEQYKNIRSQIWTVLAITVVGFVITFIRIETVRCHCSNMKVEASGNTIINEPSSKVDPKLLREMLIKKGLLNARSDPM